jgi:anion-transporting  ArsA/GET3 family ATPase
MNYEWPGLVVVVGSGGVGKTTLAAALGLGSSAAGDDTLVMTFDPSLRLKDTLGVGQAALQDEIEVQAAGPGRLAASLLDAKSTFDRLVSEYAPDDEAKDRILTNRYYSHLAGNLAGTLEYMAVERLFEVWNSGRFQRIILDTPPTRQALDFLEAPSRIVGFLDSRALKIALKSWFDPQGRLKPTARLGSLGRRFERYLDEVVGLDLLRDMLEFFQAFGPLFEGFRQRASQVEKLLRSDQTVFVLVTGPGEENIADTLFFGRKLLEAGYRLGPIVVNRMHPSTPDGWRALDGWKDKGSDDEALAVGMELLSWLGDRDARGFDRLVELVQGDQPVLRIPILADEPSDLSRLGDLSKILLGQL